MLEDTNSLDGAHLSLNHVNIMIKEKEDDLTFP